MTDALLEFARLGVATVYEAAGRVGLIDVPLHRLVPASRVAGIARTVSCAQGDNLMVHAVMALAQPHDILVLTMPEAAPVALVGDLLATQARARGVAGMLIDAAVRDADELSAMTDLPIWARYLRASGATRTQTSALEAAVTIGGTLIRQGDLIVMDGDGAVAVANDRIQTVLEAARQRGAREARLRAQFAAGTLSVDLYGLRDQLREHLPR